MWQAAGYGWQETLIDMDGGLRSPLVFVYEVRPELHDLKPLAKEPVAALYLAHLLLRTSWLRLEPFTGTTDTARGLQMLCSGLCCGNLVPTMDVGVAGSESTALGAAVA